MCALTNIQLETHGAVIETAAADGLALKYQTISNHNTGLVFIALPKIHKQKLRLLRTARENEITFCK